MKTQFTKLTANFGCYKYDNNAQDNFLPDEIFTISDVLDAPVSLKDKAWFIRFNCGFTDKQFREFAIGCALIVLPIYENKYPDNKAPREAIEAAQAYLAGTIGLDELRVKKRAAAAAYAAAYAADAAAYAADAAAYTAYTYAADAAAYAAAYAADAADAAAYAAADADRKVKNVTYQDLLLQFFRDFIK